MNSCCGRPIIGWGKGRRERLLTSGGFGGIWVGTEGSQPMTALATLATAVARATPATPEDKARLQEVEQLLCGEKLMSVSAVARMLGVSSPTTIHNWLEKG